MTADVQTGKVLPDRLPGTFDKRVFVGGNYDNIGVLRKIKKVVQELDLGLTPILPRDDVEIPLHEVHDWDLRILHNCRYAIFEVSVVAGELMEIERVREYGTQTLLLYQSRNEGPPTHITRMLRTFKLPLMGYFDTEHLEEPIREFLVPPMTLDATMQQYIKLVGYCFSSVSVFDEIQRDGISTEILQFKGLKATGDKPVTMIEPHEWAVSSGEIFDVKFRVLGGEEERVKWEKTRDESKVVAGMVVIDPPLQKGVEEISYEFTVKSRGAYCLTKNEYKHLYPDDPVIEESYERKIVHPIDKLEMGVRFYAGYPFGPRVAIYYGAYQYQDVDATTDRMLSFQVPNPTEAVLNVTWPKPGHRYVILWEPAEAP